MSVQEIESAISRLSSNELAQLAEWFAEFHGEVWDRQIERDSQAGKLDALIEQANREFDAGNCKPL